MKAAVHLGPIYVENLEVYRNTHFEELENLFDITQKQMSDRQGEILNVKNDWLDSSPMGEIYTCSRSGDSVDDSKSTCLLRFRTMLGELSDHSEANRRWKNQVK